MYYYTVHNFTCSMYEYILVVVVYGTKPQGLFSPFFQAILPTTYIVFQAGGLDVIISARERRLMNFAHINFYQRERDGEKRTRRRQAKKASSDPHSAALLLLL